MSRPETTPGARRLPLPHAVLLSFFLVLRALPAGEFETANERYDAGRFAEAKRGYEQLVDAGLPSANVWYNLANTDYRLGSIGRAILGYERVLALDPGHAEATANLKLLREQSHARDLRRTFLERALVRGSESHWTIVTTVAAWLAVLCLVRIATRRGGPAGTLWLIAGEGLLLVLVGAVALRAHRRDHALAVVTAREAEAHLAPAESAALAGFLPAGSRVRVLSERGPWTYCELPDEKRGWLPAGSLERIRPAKS